MAIELTDSAKNQLNILISSQNKDKKTTVARVSLTRRGVGSVSETDDYVSGLYNIALTEQFDPEKDWVFEEADGLKIVADKDHFDQMNGVTVDFNQGFAFKQAEAVACGTLPPPDGKGGGGCGSGGGTCGSVTPVSASSSCGTRDSSGSTGGCGCS